MNLTDVGNRLRNEAVSLRNKADYYESVANGMDIVANEIVDGNKSLDIDINFTPSGLIQRAQQTKPTKRIISAASRKKMSIAQKRIWAEKRRAQLIPIKKKGKAA
jgi:hypothetical protein